MDAFMMLLPFLALLIAWFFVARFFKNKGKGTVIRHLAGAAVGFLALVLCAICVAPPIENNLKTASTSIAPSQKSEPNDKFATFVGKDVAYNVNEKGVLIFANARNMFDSFNDYREEEGELTFLSENPLSLKINKHLDEGEPNLKEYSEMSFLYAIYRTFMNTQLNEIMVEAYPITVDYKTHKKTEHKKYAFKATVSREKALNVLKKHSSAASFDDLVQTTENTQHRIVGISGSEVWDKFIYNEKQRSQIVADLMK